MISERRKARSARPSEALALLLEHAKNSLGVSALTLGTTEGHLIVGSGEDAERVAEEGARQDAGERVTETLATWRMRVGDAVMLLTSAGGAMDPSLGPSVRRILVGA